MPLIDTVKGGLGDTNDENDDDDDDNDDDDDEEQLSKYILDMDV